MFSYSSPILRLSLFSVLWNGNPPCDLSLFPPPSDPHGPMLAKGQTWFGVHWGRIIPPSGPWGLRRSNPWPRALAVSWGWMIPPLLTSPGMILQVRSWIFFYRTSLVGKNMGMVQTYLHLPLNVGKYYINIPYIWANYNISPNLGFHKIRGWSDDKPPFGVSFHVSSRSRANLTRGSYGIHVVFLLKEALIHLDHILGGVHPYPGDNALG